MAIYEKHKCSPNVIYNVYETGVLTVPHKSSKILALQGKNQVGCLTFAERGVPVTVEICMKAAGKFKPPMFIFPRVRENPLFMDGAFPGLHIIGVEGLQKKPSLFSSKIL